VRNTFLTVAVHGSVVANNSFVKAVILRTQLFPSPKSPADLAAASWAANIAAFHHAGVVRG
jgi:hypothetical protein